MLGRVIISWFPEIEQNPVELLAWPAEPLLGRRRSCPGVGVGAFVIWIAVASLIREPLLGASASSS